MKTRLGILNLLIVLCSAVATTAVFGQTTYTWTGAADGTNFLTAGNWIPAGGPPSGGDTAQWDGVTTSNLFIALSSGLADGGVPQGINFLLTSNQTNSVNIYSAVAPFAGNRLSNFYIASGAGAFSLGNDTSNALNLVMGAFSGEVQNFVNNSANAATIYPNVRWAMGGGGTHTFLFDGSGDWNVNNYLVSANGSPTLVTKQGYGTMTWTGSNVPNSVGNSVIASPLTINDGTLVLETSDLLTNQAIANNATLIYDAATGSCTLAGVISGTGTLEVSDGTLTLTATNTCTGLTTVSNGTLLVNGQLDIGGVDVEGGVLGGTGTILGPVTIQSGGTLAPGGSISSVGTLTINNNLSSGGNLAIAVNKALSPSNSLVVVSGVLTNTGSGTLTVSNLGPAFAAGDTFTLFSQPLQNGVALTVTGGGANWVNNLAVDGSIIVTSFVPAPTLNFTQIGNSVQFSWTASFKLQSQTNSLNVGLSTNWVDYPGGGTSPVTVPMDATQGTVFFRLVSP